VRHGGGDRLADFVSDRGGQLAHGRDAVGVSKFHQGLAVAPLVFPSLGLNSLELAQIENEADALASVLFEHCAANQDRNATAVLAEILLLEWLDGPDPLKLCNVLRIVFVPFGWRQRPAMQPTRSEVLPIVPDDAEKGVIGLEDTTFQIPDHDS